MITKVILIVEDDKDLQEYLKEFFTDKGFSVFTTEKGAEALKMVDDIEPDLTVLDLSLPDLPGEEVCRKIKQEFPDIAILILTGKDTTSDIVKGLNIGADDYMTKPFSGEELLARVKARLRESSGNAKIKVHDLELDTSKIEVTRQDKDIDLTPQEFKLLEYLMQNKNRVLSRDIILNRVWESNADIETRVVDVYIGYLRKKIDKDFEIPLIHSVRGFGYVIRDPKREK